MSRKSKVFRWKKSFIAATKAAFPTLTRQHCVWAERTLPSKTLADWSDKLKADEFTEWLRKQLDPTLSATMAIDETEVKSLAAAAASQKTFEEMQRDGKSKIKISTARTDANFIFRRRGTSARRCSRLCSCWSSTVLPLSLFICTRRFYFRLSSVCSASFCFFGTFSVWFKSSRVTIDSTNVRATNRWLIFSRTRQFSAE